MERTIEDLFGAGVAQKSSFLKPPSKLPSQKENENNNADIKNENFAPKSLFPPKINSPVSQIVHSKPAFIIKPTPPVQKVKIDPSKTQISLENWFIFEDMKSKNLLAVGHRQDINEVSYSMISKSLLITSIRCG